MAGHNADTRLAELIAGLRTGEARGIIATLPAPARGWLDALATSDNPEATLDDIAAGGGSESELRALLAVLGPRLGGALPTATDVTPRAPTRLPVTPNEDAVHTLLSTLEAGCEAAGAALVREANQARDEFARLAQRLGDADSAALTRRAQALKERLRSLRHQQRETLPRLVREVLVPASSELVELAKAGPAHGRLVAALVQAAVAESAFSIGAAGDPTPLWQALFRDALAAGPDALPLAERAADRLRGAALDAANPDEAITMTRALRDRAHGPDGHDGVALGAELDLTILGAQPAEALSVDALDGATYRSLEERATRGLVIAMAQRAVDRADAALEVLVRLLLALGDGARPRLIGRLFETRTAFERTFGEEETRRLDRHLGLVREAWGETGLVAAIEAFRAAMRAQAVVR
ncbi:MAG: hypothetical protein IV100_20985 [Myxococcales bacterium]|nr:hypothetical protein [Myxococcales bacterium]